MTRSAEGAILLAAKPYWDLTISKNHNIYIYIHTGVLFPPAFKIIWGEKGGDG
jgi:hypothetical protein